MSVRNPRNPSAEETEAEMAARVFSSEPMSFRMDRKSPLASQLKASVSSKLLEFLGNYSDEVLAEYIVVLVCHGKHQNQARDDLVAFLGDDTERFVAWLWDHLSRQICNLKAPLDSSSLNAELTSSHDDVLHKEQITNRPADLHTHSAEHSDIELSKDERYEPPYFRTSSKCSNTIEVSESLQRWCPTIDATLTEVDTGSLQAEVWGIHKDSGATDCNRVTKSLSSRVICSAEMSSGGEQCLHYDFQHRKIAKVNPSAVLCRPLPVPKTEEVAKNSKSITAEDHQLRHLSMRNAVGIRLPSATTDAVPHQNSRLRGNVWDRLGKPCKEDDAEVRERRYQHGISLSEREKLDLQGEELWSSRSMGVVADAQLSSNLIGESAVRGSSGGNGISNDHSNEYRMQRNSFHTVGNLNHVNSSKRKRLVVDSNSGNSLASFSGCKENHLPAKEAPPKLQDSLPIKYNRLQSLNEFTSGAEGSTIFSEPASHSVKSASIEPDLQIHKISQSQLNRSTSITTPMQKRVPVKSQLPSKSESLSHAESGNASSRPAQDEVLDVKLRLRQIEMDMLKLRSKQAEMSNDTKPNPSSGVQNRCEEDIESRTVLVTNVHFAATREALLSYFSKCGVVVKVVLLTDTITAQPKGAAYIVFASKDSVDKAVSLTGTSFFSRILTVMRKADMPSGFLVPSQPAGKLLQPFFPQPYKKGAVQRHYISSHLQWRRDQPASGGNSQSATTNGLESSNTE